MRSGRSVSTRKMTTGPSGGAARTRPAESATARSAKVIRVVRRDVVRTKRLTPGQFTAIRRDRGSSCGDIRRFRSLDFSGKESNALPVKSTISAKGQITVPAAVRQRLGLSAGTPVTFELRREGVLLRKGSRGRHPVDEVYGILRLPKSVDATLDEMRGPRPGRR